MIKTSTLFFALVVYMICFCPEVLCQTDFNPYKLETSGFQFCEIDGQLLLTLPDETRIEIPKEWLYPAEEVIEEQGAVVSSFNYLKPVNSFSIGKHLVGLHLASWDSMAPGTGSAMAASGRDVFLVYHTKTQELSLGFPEHKMTKNRYRSMGCFLATFHKFIIGDINNDGLTDIGVTLEKIWCESRSDEAQEIDHMDGPYYKKYPIEWYISKVHKWEKAPSYKGIRPKMAIQELPVIGLEKSPVEFVREIYRDNLIEINEHENNLVERYTP